METIRNIPRPSYAHVVDGLKALYARMDRGYAEAAANYGFDCRGCEDNCCMTRFYHHTHLEYLYVLEGYGDLAPDTQAAINGRAEEALAKTARADGKGDAPRVMCPLNIEGLCILYAHRPMICRLHGIPNELRKPGRDAVYGPGCEAFTRLCGGKAYYPFDRTPFYIEMARLEDELKQAAGISGKFKMTVAEMVRRA